MPPMKNYWICYEVNETDTAHTTDCVAEIWTQQFESFDNIWDADVRWNELLSDKELYRNVSPILVAHNP